MTPENAQRILWFAVIFIVLGIIATVVAGIVMTLAIAFVDIGSFVNDPTVAAFLQSYPWVIPIVIWIFAGLQVIYFAIIYTWRKDPVSHRTGLTIVGILNLLIGFTLTGLFIILPGLLLEEHYQ